MSTATTFYGSGWESLLHAWRELDVPEGWRAEIDSGGITMTPPPSDRHNDIADVLHRALVRAVPESWGIYQTRGIAIVATGNLYIPDLLVLPRDAPKDEDRPVSAEHARLVVEITSKSSADHDRLAKRWAYANGPVPLYLLVDAFDAMGPHATLFSDPASGEYRHSVRTPFGDRLAIPAPFDLALDTTAFG